MVKDITNKTIKKKRRENIDTLIVKGRRGLAAKGRKRGSFVVKIADLVTELEGRIEDPTKLVVATSIFSPTPKY